jgi:hypothetical protein
VPVAATAESETASTKGTLAPPIEVEASGVTRRVRQDADPEALTRLITAAKRWA